MLCYVLRNQDNFLDLTAKPSNTRFLVYFTKEDQPTMLSVCPKQSKCLCLGQATNRTNHCVLKIGKENENTYVLDLVVVVVSK